MTYERVVAAAVAETTSKFKLAEALALDIPPRNRGGSVENERSVGRYLEEARQAIAAAGGEPRGSDTLDKYRRTALWASVESSAGNGRTFHWVPGFSYTSHNEARMAGLSYEEFAANPMKTDEIRRSIGKAGTDGQPRYIARNWSPEDRVEVVREALADPNIADAVVADRRTRWDVQAAARRQADELDDQLEEQRTEAVTSSKSNLATMVAGEIGKAREALTAAKSLLEKAGDEALDEQVRTYVTRRLPAVTELVADITILVGAADWDEILRSES